MPPSDAIGDNPLIGSNNPPEPTPYEQSLEKITDIYSEASLWLDGAAVNSQELADGIGNLLDAIRKARKFADDARKVEKSPFDAGAAEVQGRYNPLLEKADLATAACKKALAPWLNAEDARVKREAAAARAEADRKRQEAEDALRASDAQNLAEREAAEVLLRDAKKADTAANVAARQTAKAGGGFGRAIGLRTTYRHEITDAKAFARWVWLNDSLAMDAFLEERARQLTRDGMRMIPGVTVHEEKAAA